MTASPPRFPDVVLPCDVSLITVIIPILNKRLWLCDTELSSRISVIYWLFSEVYVDAQCLFCHPAKENELQIPFFRSSFPLKVFQQTSQLTDTWSEIGYKSKSATCRLFSIFTSRMLWNVWSLQFHWPKSFKTSTETCQTRWQAYSEKCIL